ncbi:MAG: hypothetical protein ACLFMO_03575 [Eubacteriales bacterium]
MVKKIIILGLLVSVFLPWLKVYNTSLALYDFIIAQKIVDSVLPYINNIFEIFNFKLYYIIIGLCLLLIIIDSFKTISRIMMGFTGVVALIILRKMLIDLKESEMFFKDTTFATEVQYGGYIYILFAILFIIVPFIEYGLDKYKRAK